jgi:hypothetical protein
MTSGTSHRGRTQFQEQLPAEQPDVRSRAELTHDLQEILRIGKKTVRRAVYHASRVRVPNRACRRVRGIKPNRSGTYPGERMLLLPEWAEYESPQKLFVNIRGQIGFRVCRVAYDLALIVDPKCDPVRIAIHRRKSVGGGRFPTTPAAESDY